MEINSKPLLTFVVRNITCIMPYCASSLELRLEKPSICVQVVIMKALIISVN